MTLLPASLRPFWLEGEDPHPGNVSGLGGFFAVCYTAGMYAGLYAPSMEGNWGWYPKLLKPAWTPSPAWNGLAWLVMYGCMAVAGWRVWRTGTFRIVPFAAAGFALQLFLQAMWSTCFYGMQSPLLGLLDLLGVSALSAMLWFTYKAADRVAGWLWTLYLCWLGYLTAANAAIWWLNA